MAARHTIKVGNEVRISGNTYTVTKVTVEPKGEGYECRIALNRRGRPFTGSGATEQDAIKDAEVRLGAAS